MKNETYYISSGALTRMYTLRVRYPEMIAVEGGNAEVIRDYYICNLATDADRALCKARTVAQAHGADLVEGELESLDEIRRRESAEIEAARMATEARAEEERLERQAKWTADKVETIARGFWPYGKFAGLRFEETPLSYAHYFITLENEEDDAVLTSLQNVLKVMFPQLVNLPTPNGEYFSEIKKRSAFSITLIAELSYEGFYGRVYIQKFVTDSGELVVYKGTAPVQIKLAETAEVKATVKAHDVYEGQNQTMIQRIAGV